MNCDSCIDENNEFELILLRDQVLQSVCTMCNYKRCLLFNRRLQFSMMYYLKITNVFHVLI